MSIKGKFSAAKRGVKKGLSAPFKAVGAADDAFHKKHPVAYRSAITACDLGVAGIGVATIVTTGGIAAPVLGGILALLAGDSAVKNAKQVKKLAAQKKNPPPSNGF